MKKEDLIVLADKYATGNCSPEEKITIEYFFDGLQNTKAELTDTLLQEKREIILNYINTNITASKVKTRSLWKQPIKIAASLFIMAGLAFCYSLLTKETRMVTQIAAKGEKKEVLLNDGSVVVLNSNSSITYPEIFETTRQITLKGEAYFKVQHNPQKPFIVETGGVDVTVLGTSFNINAYSTKNTKVSVITGRVEVAGKNGKKVILTKGGQADYTITGGFKLAKDKSCEGIAWTKNIIMLKNTTLAETAKILENWYDVKIEFEDKSIGQLTISGKFKDEKLETVMESIAFLKGLKIDYKTKKHIVIRRNTIIDP